MKLLRRHGKAAKYAGLVRHVAKSLIRVAEGDRDGDLDSGRRWPGRS